jgi:DNA-binding beta-propeller fold protein YncE
MKKVVLAVMLMAAMAIFPGITAAKSLYVIPNTNLVDELPIQAYRINADGTVALQAQRQFTFSDPIGLAIDSPSATLFVCGEHVVGNVFAANALHLTGIGNISASGVDDAEGIVMDEANQLLYVGNHGTSTLNIYQWDAANKTLTKTLNSPVTLPTPTGGFVDPLIAVLALDPTNNLLYVGNFFDQVYIYHTSDWSAAGKIDTTSGATPVAIAVDSTNQYLYYGSGWAPSQDTHLRQYNLATNQENSVTAGLGVLGLAVDNSTGVVYVGTGNKLGDPTTTSDLMVFDSTLSLLQTIPNIGSAATGLVVPTSDTVAYQGANGGTYLLLLD